MLGVVIVVGVLLAAVVSVVGLVLYAGKCALNAIARDDVSEAIDWD